MNLPTAIEIKTRTPKAFLNTNRGLIEQADRLSIEAMKRIQACREPQGGSPLPLLCTETEY